MKRKNIYLQYLLLLVIIILLLTGTQLHAQYSDTYLNNQKATNPKVEKTIKLFNQGKSEALDNYLKKIDVKLFNNKLTIIVELTPLQKSSFVEYCKNNNITISSSLGWDVIINVNIKQLTDICNSENLKYKYLRYPHPLQFETFDHDALKQTYASQYLNQNQNLGSSLKIGVIDYGFGDYDEYENENYVPLLDNPHRWVTFPFSFYGGDQHGSMVMEVLYSYMPGAEYFGARPINSDWIDEAIMWMTNQDVDIITSSIGSQLLPMNYNHDIFTAIENFVNNGGIFVQAAGNYGKSHWMGTFNDSNGNGYLEFETGNEELNIHETDEKISISLNWSENAIGNQNTTEQYQIELYDSSNNQLLESSDLESNGPAWCITEYIPTNDISCYVKIKQTNGTNSNVLHLFLADQDFEENWNPEKSLTILAGFDDATSIAGAFFSNQQLMYYSSQGPAFFTNHTKPDFTSYTGQEVKKREDNSWKTKSFHGTSCAAPNFAGILGVIWDQNEDFSNSQVLQEAIILSEDFGSTGKDNLFGSGLTILDPLENVWDGFENSDRSDFPNIPYKDYYNVFQRTFHNSTDRDSATILYDSGDRWIISVVGEVSNNTYIHLSNINNDYSFSGYGSIQFQPVDEEIVFVEVYPTESVPENNEGYKLIISKPKALLTSPMPGHIINGKHNIIGDFYSSSTSFFEVDYIEFDYSTDSVTWLPVPNSANSNKDVDPEDGIIVEFDTQMAGIIYDESVWIRYKSTTIYGQSDLWWYSNSFMVDNLDNSDEPSLALGSVSPSTGTTDDTFEFSVYYKDQSNLAPTSVTVKGATWQLAMNANGNNWSNGVQYTKNFTVPNPGIVEYYFEAETNTGEIIRYPESGFLQLNIIESAVGWEVDVSDVNANPNYLTDGGNFSVSAHVHNASNTSDKIYNNLDYSFDLFSPNGSLLDSKTGTISTINQFQTVSISKNFSLSNSPGNYRVECNISPGKDNNTTNNTGSDVVIVGQDEPSHQFVITETVVIGEGQFAPACHPYQGNTYCLTHVSPGSYIRISQDGDDSERIYDNNFFEFNNDQIVLINNGGSEWNGDEFATVSFGVENTDYVTFDNTKLTCYPGDRIIFKAYCTDNDFENSDPNFYDNSYIDEWFHDVDTENNVDSAYYEFDIPTDAPYGEHTFFMGCELDDDNEEFLRELAIVVIAPPPSISSISSNSISADDIIVITGTNFSDNAQTVKFGDIEVASSNITNWTMTSITCIAPEGIQNGNIRVITSSGSSNGIPYQVISSTGDPEVVQAVPDQSMEGGTSLIVADLNNVFWDPNGDNMNFSVQYTSSSLTHNGDFQTTGLLEFTAADGFTEDVTVTISAADSEGSADDEFVISVTPSCTPISSCIISSSQNICANTSPQALSVTTYPTANGEIISFQWQASINNSVWNDVENETTDTFQPPSLSETTYYRLKVEAPNTCGIIYSNVVEVTIPGALVSIISEDQSLCIDSQSNEINSINTGGKGSYTYQWQKLETDWIDITGATADSYQPPINDNHHYRLLVSDDCITEASNTIEIITYDALSLSLTDANAICGDAAAETLEAIASGGASNYSYQWYEKTTGDWNEIVGATQSTYEPGVLSEATYFKVELTDDCGALEEETFVDIYPEMDILLSSTSETVCYQAYTSSFTATVSGGDGNYQYQWYKWINEDTVAIVGQTSSVLAPQYIEEETTFVLGVFNACGFTLSELININMYLPLSTLASSSQTICYNSAPSVLSAYASGGHGTNSYQWQQLADGSWVDIPDANQLYYQPETLTSTTSYRMEFSNECDLIYSNAVEITVLDPVMVTVSDDQIICDGTVPALLSAVASGGDLSYTYQWQILQGANWTDITDAVADDYLPDAVVGETHYRVVVTNTCATVESEEIIVGVYDPFVAGSIEGDQILCFGETPVMLTSATMPSGGAENYVYQWQDSLVGGNWADIPGATSQDYQPEILPDTTYFRLICVDVCETAISNVLEVGVYDEMMPGSIGTDQLICFGAIPSPLTITTAAQGGNSVFTYQWQQSVDNANWTDIQDATDATYQPPSISEEIYYRLQFTSVVGCGVLYSNAVNVNIVPLPIAAAGVDDGVCETNSFQLNAMADNFESLSWASSGDGTFDDNTVLNPVYIPGTNDLASGTAILTLTANPIYPCQNAATDDLMLTIVYLPEADAGTDATICENYSHEITTATASNYSQISWEGGDGSFVNGSTLNPTYIYGPNDLLNGGVTLTMTAYSMVACATEASDEMYLTIAYQPVVTAMEDTTICETDCLELDATVENATNITWTTNGDGTFNNIHLIQATYCPGTNDIASGSVELTITAVPSGVCTQNASDSFTLSITNGPIVDAGADITSCASADEIPITDASAQHFGSLLWTSSGDGSFSNTAALITSYSPGTQDASSGSVTLTLTAESLDPCVLTATDNLTINLSPLPTANAGSDIEVCENESITLSGSATNYSTLHWSNISGDGTFDCTDCLSPIFTPGTTDINNGFVTVVFTVSAIDPCSEEVTDTMQITIQEGPFAYAGIDGEICAGENYTLSGFVQNNTGRHWSTSGDGSFSNTNFLNATYYPGPSDIVSGSVVITLHAGATAPCTGETTDDMTITIHALPIVDAGNDFTVMQNTEVQLNGSMSGGSGNLSPHWSPESLLYNPSVLNPNTMPIPSTTQFTLTVVDNAYGCENSDVVTLIVEPGVTYNISGAIISQNLRNPIENAWVRFHGDYFADSTTTQANGNYSIDIPSGWCGWSSVNYPGYIFIPDSTEILFLDHDITDGAFSGTIFLEAVANPDTVDLGDPVSLNAVVHNPNGTVTYQWSSIPEGFESSVQNPEDFPLTSTLYKVIVSDQFETSWDTVSVFVDTLAVGFSEHEGNIVFKVYPNPTKDYLFVEVEGENELQYIRILTVEGQIAEEKKVSLGSHFIKKSFNVQSHPNGVYFIELVTKDGLTIKSKRFVKIAY